jgi:hypothetical protein
VERVEINYFSNELLFSERKDQSAKTTDFLLPIFKTRDFAKAKNQAILHRETE